MTTISVSVSLMMGATCLIVYTCLCHDCPKGMLYRHKVLSRFAGSREPFIIACSTSYSLAPRSLYCSLACCVNLLASFVVLLIIYSQLPGYALILFIPSLPCFHRGGDNNDFYMIIISRRVLRFFCLLSFYADNKRYFIQPIPDR